MLERCFGSKADLTARESDFRSTPDSGLRAEIASGPFRANTGSPFGSMQGEAPSPSRRSVQRRQDRGKPLLYLGARFRMREYVEFILAYCGEDQQSYMRRVEP
jgi:hypothetical protein